MGICPSNKTAPELTDITGIEITRYRLTTKGKARPVIVIKQRPPCKTKARQLARMKG